MYYLRAFAFFVVLSMGMIASAADWPPPDGVTDGIVIGDNIYNVTETTDPGDPYVLGSLDINAPAGNRAGLFIGGGDWTGTLFDVNKLTMNGVAAGTITAIPGPAGNFTGRAVVLVNNNKRLNANELEMNGSSFIGVGYSEVDGTPEYGQLSVGSLSLSGANSQLWVSQNGTLAADNVYVNAGSIRMDGRMDGGAAGTFEMSGNSKIDLSGTMTGYAIDIKSANATFNVTGRAEGDDALFSSNGTVLVDGVMDGFGAVKVNGGSFTVSNDATVTGGTDSTFTSAGTVTVSGTIGNFDAVNVTGGTFTIAGGDVTSDIAHSDGALVVTGGRATAISTTGGSLTLNGTNPTVGTLGVSGAADVWVNAAATATSLVMDGGGMTLNTGGALTVGNGGTFGGAWNMQGGSVTFAGPVNFTDGEINVRNNGGAIIMTGGGDLSISSTLNASDNLTIDMNGGGFTLNGRYAVDYGENGGTLPLVTVTGATRFTAGGGMSVTMDSEAHTAFNNAAGPDGLLILGTDAASYSGITSPMTSASNAASYTYEVKNIGGAGYGLYVTGIDLFGRSKMAANLVNSWNRHPRVDGNAGKLFNGSFTDAVIDGYYLLVDGGSPVLDDPSANFNARTLFGIMERENTGTGYDALMLYNGSGLTAANDAVLNVNRHFLRRMSDRSGVIRREVIVDELEQPASVNEAEDPNVRLYGDPAATRLWAEGLYYSDSAGGGDGFAGYDYDGKGLMLGADKRENDIWYGAALAYVNGTFRDKAALDGDGGIDSYAALVHAGWQDAGGLYVTGTLGYSYSDNALRDRRRLNENRTIGMNEADFGTHSFMVALEGGSDFRLGEYLIVTPSAGLAYVTSRGGAHEQWFNGSDGKAAQTLDAKTITGSSFSIPLGLAASMDVYGDEDSLLSITGKAGYAYEFQNKGARGEFSYGGLQGVIDPVQAASRAPGRHSWNLGLSARYLYDNMEFGLGYEYFGRDNSASHAFTLSAGVNF